MRCWLVWCGFLLVSGLAAGGHVAVGQDEAPYQFREPRKFWMNKVVFQKRGIVIEDEDCIVRKRYWVLDPSVEGQVVNVEEASGRQVFVSVRFRDEGGGWREHGVNIQDRVVTKTNRTVTVRPNPYSGGGGSVDSDEVSFSYRIEGEEVDPRKCGLVIRREGATVEVRYPAHLLSLASPRKGDTVVRSWDWHDGYADGGRKATGRNQGDATDCIGTVLKERADDGFIDVKWHKTGRTKSHRFDHLGYYDVEPVR